MRNLKLYIRDFLDAYARITTGITLICAISVSLADNSSEWMLYRNIMWQVLATAAVTALVTVVCLPCTLAERTVSKRESVIRFVLHYLLINASAMFMGYKFLWFSLKPQAVALMAIGILFVYIFVALITYINDKQYADEINVALKKHKKK